MKKYLKKKYTYESRSKNKGNKIRVSRLVHAYAWTTLRAHNQACVCNLDRVHVGFYPEILETQQTVQGFKTWFLAT